MGNYTLRVHDLAGCVIIEMQATPLAGQLQVEVDLSAQSAGMHVVEFNDGKLSSFGRVVKH